MVDDNVRIEIGTKRKEMYSIFSRKVSKVTVENQLARVNILRIYQKETIRLLHTCSKFLVDQSMMATQWDLLLISIQSLQR